MMGLAFTTPLILLAALALPILWILLRAIPPAAIQRRFPAVTLLLGLKEEESETATTPWWLLLLRMLAVLALILAFAGPILRPDSADTSNAPLLVVMEGSWAEVADWDTRTDAAVAALTSASRQGRTTAFVVLTDPNTPEINFAAGAEAATRAAAARPAAWVPDYGALNALDPDMEFDTLWLASPVAHPGQMKAMERLAKAGTVTATRHDQPTLALGPPSLLDGAIQLTAFRPFGGGVEQVDINILGTSPTGDQRILGTQSVDFETAKTQASATFDLPAELLSRVTAFEVSQTRHAGTVALADDGIKRREIALFTGAAGQQEGEALLSQDHFLRQALVGQADLIDGTLGDILQANPDVLIVTDVGTLPNPDEILNWVAEGGHLIRFAGPRLATAEFDRADADPLLPVRIRAGGRNLGGAMSWGSPKRLRAFDPDGPFAGLVPPQEVAINAQVLAEPGPDLAGRVIAQLEDGTPLVTQSPLAQGQLTLFHVTANTDWSNLPLSGLFVQMIHRLTLRKGTVLDTATITGSADLKQALTAFGPLTPVPGRPPVLVADLLGKPTSATLIPGLYDGPRGTIARNVLQTGQVPAPTVLPAGVIARDLSQAPEVPLMPHLLILALALFALDALVTLAMTGRLTRAAQAMPVVLALMLFPQSPQAQTNADDAAIARSVNVVFGYIVTGNKRVDDTSFAGLNGLSRSLFARTSVEPVSPVGIDPAVDELAFFPMIYWPVTPDQTPLTQKAVTKLNRYLKSGGLIVFDTRDGNVAGLGQGVTPEGRKLRQIASRLEIPALQPVPEGHVLTRSFYLLQDFPGRHVGGRVWVEATLNDESNTTGFRNLNDGVSPVIIGGNDWAAAWAQDDNGVPMFQIGGGFQGERQRELAVRFGVNLVMYVLTGNYKSDQVHVPDILKRMGQ